MSHVRRWPLLVLGAILALARPAAGQDRAAGTTVVVLVRHAERASDGGADPSLTAVGRARADELAALLGKAEVTGILTTPFARTRETAAPLAQARDLEVRAVPVAGGLTAHVAQTVEAIRGPLAGGTVLVVGHGNTVPGILSALGGPAIPTLCEAAYDRLFILVLEPGQSPRFLETRYGGPSEACS